MFDVWIWLFWSGDLVNYRVIEVKTGIILFRSGTFLWFCIVVDDDCGGFMDFIAVIRAAFHMKFGREKESDFVNKYMVL